MSKHQGISLVEVLISIFLSTFLAAVLLHVYCQSQKGYLQTQAFLTKEYETLWVSDMLSTSIRQAGFTPCLRLNLLSSLDGRNPGLPLESLSFANGANGFIKIGHMRDTFNSLLEQGQILLVDDKVKIRSGHPVMIADCYHAEVFIPEKINRRGPIQEISLPKPLYFQYRPPTFVGEWQEEKWFIRTNAKGVNTLHYQAIQAEELSQEIRGLQIRWLAQAEHKLLEITLQLPKAKDFSLAVWGPNL